MLFSGTVRENLAYARPDALEEDVREAAILANAHEYAPRTLSVRSSAWAIVDVALTPIYHIYTHTVCPRAQLHHAPAAAV